MFPIFISSLLLSSVFSRLVKCRKTVKDYGVHSAHGIILKCFNIKLVVKIIDHFRFHLNKNGHLLPNRSFHSGSIVFFSRTLFH